MPLYRLHTPTRPEGFDYMFFVDQSDMQAVARAKKVDLAIALGAPDSKDCPLCQHPAPRVNA